MVIRTYDRSSKRFILIVDGLGPNDTQMLSFIPKFYPQYVQMVEAYNIGRPTTFLAKNVGSFMFGEQQLLTKFSNILVIHVLDVATTERLVEVHNKHTEGHDFEVNFEICIKQFFSFVLLCKLLYQISNLIFFHFVFHLV